MKNEVYIMQDRVSRMYGDMFECPNDATMIRGFKASIDAYREAGVPFDDVVVIHLGHIIKEFDRVCFFPCEIRQIICKGSDFDVRTSEEVVSTSTGDSL